MLFLGIYIYIQASSAATTPEITQAAQRTGDEVHLVGDRLHDGARLWRCATHLELLEMACAGEVHQGHVQGRILMSGQGLVNRLHDPLRAVTQRAPTHNGEEDWHTFLPLRSQHGGHGQRRVVSTIQERTSEGFPVLDLHHLCEGHRHGRTEDLGHAVSAAVDLCIPLDAHLHGKSHIIFEDVITVKPLVELCDLPGRLGHAVAVLHRPITLLLIPQQLGDTRQAVHLAPELAFPVHEVIPVHGRPRASDRASRALRGIRGVAGHAILGLHVRISHLQAIEERGDLEDSIAVLHVKLLGVAYQVLEGETMAVYRRGPGSLAPLP
mmetsp:Transcript_130154/g.278131  ORF Transcript_130154/g.278131 Transcript_130154/m.278131 type:complete len:324 (-) Transcript_130154:262-1233(-)